MATSARRKTAKHTKIYIGGVQIADAYGCKFDIANSFEDSAAFEDDFEKPEPTKGKWSGSAKRYVTNGAVTLVSRAAGTMTQGTPARIIAYDNNSVKVFEGDCWIETGGMDMEGASLMKDDCTFVGFGDPIYVA
jgi:hypothetical protein